MGKNLFRDGRYCKTVVVGKRTVKAGERAALWSLGGKIREVEGPQRVWMWFTTVRFLDRFAVDQFQYLRIQHRTGVVEHVAGPKTMFLNPVLHESVEVRDAMVLGDQEAVVVFSQQAQGVPATPAVDDIKPASAAQADMHVGHSSAMSRRTILGPAVFVPTATDWLQEFPWLLPKGPPAEPSARNNRRKGGRGDGNAALHKLSLAAQATSCWLEGAQTEDGSEVNMELAVDWAVRDVGTFAAAAAGDPPAAIRGAATADARAVCGATPLPRLLAGPDPGSATGLAAMGSYPQLRTWAGAHGVELLGMRLVGLEKVRESQCMAAAQRTAGQAAAQAEAEAKHALGRLALEAELAAQRIRAAHAAEAQAAEAKAAAAAQEAALARQDAAHRQALRHSAERQARELERYAALHALGVDLTQLLVAQAAPPSQAGKEGPGAAPPSSVYSVAAAPLK